MIIRDARPGDCPELHRLIQEHASFEQADCSLTKEALARLLSQPSPPTRLIVTEGLSGLVGYAALTADYSLWRGDCYVHLDCLFVSPAARGRGIGKRLLTRVKHIAVEMGLARLEWQTPEWNTDAVRFYIREGANGLSKIRFSIALRKPPGTEH